MAIDNGIVVAISSIATAIVAGSITLLSKVIDTIQKRNEQAMVIKTTYVNKKIESSQIYISRNMIRINSTIAERMLFENYKIERKLSNEFQKYVQAFQEILDEFYKSSPNPIGLYYSVEKYNIKIKDIMNKINLLKDQFNSSDKSEYTPEINNIVNSIIVEFENLELLYVEIGEYIRESLAQYDILQ